MCEWGSDKRIVLIVRVSAFALCLDGSSSRIINRDDLAKWAGSPLAKDRKFEPFSIYYDEDEKDRSLLVGDDDDRFYCIRLALGERKTKVISRHV